MTREQATTLLSQIGTGASQSLGLRDTERDGEGLTARVGRRHYLHIELSALDLYDVSIYSKHLGQLSLTTEMHDLYAEQLASALLLAADEIEGF